jgi:hypothetical protein
VKDSNLSNRSPAVSILACLCLSVSSLLAYVGIWRWVAPGYYLFLVLGTYLLLGGLALLQLLRTIWMDRWTPRLGAFGVVFGFAVTVFLGLRPRTACVDTGPCPSGLTPHSLQLALGIGLVTVSLFLDFRGRTTPLVGE